MNYTSIVHLHALIGFSALFTFWLVALTRKGSTVHRFAGRLYFVSMAFILLSVLPMIILRIKEANYPHAVLLGYLFSIALTASFVSWHSIRQKRSVTAYHSFFFKWLAAALTLYGLSILILGILSGSFLQLVFASVGITLGASMWRSVFSRNKKPGWHLAQHMNGAAVNFAATHGSFLKFGLASLLASPDTPELNTFSQTSMIVLALVLRIWLGRIYLNKSRTASSRGMRMPSVSNS